MAIIDVVVFFAQRAKQIMELIDAFLDSILAVVSGSVGALANLIENALARAVPVLIGFLASLLGLSGLAAKVTKIFQKIQQRVEKAITKLWVKLKEMGKKVLAKLGIGKDENAPDERTLEEKQKDLDDGVKEGTAYLKSKSKIDKVETDQHFEQIANKHQLQELKLHIVKDNPEGVDQVKVKGKVNPEKDGEVVEINWDVDENTELTEAEIEKLKSLQGGGALIAKIGHLKKERPNDGVSAIKEVRVMMSLSDGIIFVGGSISKDSKEVFFKIGNERVTISEFGEIDILSSKELIEVKTGNFVLKSKGLSTGDLDQIMKLKRLRNGNPKIYDQDKNIYDLSDKLLVLQVDQNEISPMVIAQLRKQEALDIIRLGNGAEIKMNQVPFEGKYRKPNTFSGMPTIKSLQEYLNIKL